MRKGLGELFCSSSSVAVKRSGRKQSIPCNIVNAIKHTLHNNLWQKQTHNGFPSLFPSQSTHSLSQASKLSKFTLVYDISEIAIDHRLDRNVWGPWLSQSDTVWGLHRVCYRVSTFYSWLFSVFLQKNEQQKYYLSVIYNINWNNTPHSWTS